MIKGNFQTILLFIFGIGALVGVATFAAYRAMSGGANIPEIQLWGTLPASHFSFLGDSGGTGNDYLNKIRYRQINANDFDQILVEALADGRGPDLVILKDDTFLKHRNRIYEIPFRTYSASDYYGTYISSANVFEGGSGVYALPLMVDPLVMYWNRDILTSAGMANPPEYWDEMREFSQALTKTDGFLNIERSALSLGTYSNINNAKDIISLLLMQSGSRIIGQSGGRYVADFSQTSSNLTLPPSEAINFYTEFSSPNRQVYTWNNSMPNSREAFLAEDLALYFGLASEEDSLVRANPNLNLAVSLMPQVKASDRVVTTGDLYGVAILRSSRNFNDAFTAAFHLAGQTGVAALDKNTGLPSVRNSLFSNNPNQVSSGVRRQSALSARFWPDPDSAETSAAFSRMINSVLSNELSAASSVQRLQGDLNKLLPR